MVTTFPYMIDVRVLEGEQWRYLSLPPPFSRLLQRVPEQSEVRITCLCVSSSQSNVCVSAARNRTILATNPPILYSTEIYTRGYTKEKANNDRAVSPDKAICGNYRNYDI